MAALHKFLTLPAALAAAIAMGGPAGAAEPLDQVMTGYANGSGFDWEGPYAGGYVGLFDILDGDPEIVVGKIVGYNFVLDDNVLIGIEGDIFLAPQDGDIEAFVMKRLGLILGDNALIYGTAGIGTANFSVLLFAGGFGGELAMGENLSLRGEVTWQNDSLAIFAGPMVGKLGAFFHFD